MVVFIIFYLSRKYAEAFNLRALVAILCVWPYT